MRKGMDVNHIQHLTQSKLVLAVGIWHPVLAKRKDLQIDAMHPPAVDRLCSFRTNHIIDTMLRW